MNARHSKWLLHDYLQVNGGAERLVMTLAQGLPSWRLAVSGVYGEFSERAFLKGGAYEVLGNRLSKLPRIARALLAFRFYSGRLSGAQNVIYSGVFAPLAVSQQKEGQKVMFCHTPPRFAFDRLADYLDRYPLILRPALRLMILLYRKAYLRALAKMDLIITNSNHVRQRLLALTGFDSIVIYPPIDTAHFVPLGQGDYYLSLARLEPLKRVERIIQAFIKMPEKKLIVASGGSQLERLKEIADGAANIQFTGWINDERLSHLIGHAIATLYIPEDEDFGMSAVESMAAGKPVIAVAEGGLKESVIDGKTGILLEANPSIDAIMQAVRSLSPERADAMLEMCQSHAASFSTERFLDTFKEVLQHEDK